MAKLRDSHLGIGPNRVSHDGERWHIKPPLNYSVSASLPANTALIDRRAAARMEHASNEGQLLKRAVSLTSPEVQAQVSTAVARASAVPVRSFFSSDVGTEVEAAPPLLPPPSVVELALEPVDLRQVVNVKVVRPQTTQSMVAAAFARQPAMSARQFGATMAELTVASREALSSIHIYQVDMRDVPSALRSLSAVPDGDLPALEEAIRLRRSLESTQLMDMEAANQAHLDAAAVVVAPSQPTVTNWIKADCAIAESVARFNNDKADGPKNYAWLCTDKGGKADFKQQNVGEFHWDEESGLVETTLLTCLETGGNAEDNKSSFDHATLLDNDNKDTLDLSAKNGKTELIEGLKARNADSYPKVQSGPNQGNPTGAVNIPMLTSLLKAANDDRNIVVRKAAGASAPAVPEWRRWRIATSRCLGGWFKFEV